MINYREILRQHSLGYSQRQIAASVRSSRNTVSDVIKQANVLGISWPLDVEATNEVLQLTLFPNRSSTSSPRMMPDYSHVHKELAKPGVNLTLLWTEYCMSAYESGSFPYMYSQFCDKYRHWARITKATMRIQHKPGDAMQVDWAGNTIPLHNRYTGETEDVYLFVAVLPCSNKTYAQACQNMKSELWIRCHVNAYKYFNGVTRLLIPDNLKTGITKNTRYETIINRNYSEMAEYYGTAIVPTRVKAPRDKSAVEGGVRYASTWIIAALRNRKFFTMQEISEAVAEKLNELNEYPFKKRVGNRNTAFLEEEQAFMKPLPITPYELAVWSTATIHNDYLITDGKNKYSVPFDLIGEKVDIRLTSDTVEAFFNGSRVASHPRRTITERNPIVQPDHMPMNHRKYLSYNADEFRLWAKSIGTVTETIVGKFLSSGTEPEQGFKSCASITKLASKYGHERLERACTHALIYTNEPSIRTISTILKNGQDKIDNLEGNQDSHDESIGITRGASYFNRGGATS
jgi:transposase